MSEQENRDALERFVQAFQQRDANAIAELVHDDVLEEYPQSAERIRGKRNYLRIVENIPVMPNIIDYRFTVSEDLAVAERIVECNGNRYYNTAITEMENGKVKRAGTTSLRSSKHRGGDRGGSKGCSIIVSPIHATAHSPKFVQKVCRSSFFGACTLR
jgi:ketosteroid isomerase-like protein